MALRKVSSPRLAPRRPPKNKNGQKVRTPDLEAWVWQYAREGKSLSEVAATLGIGKSTAQRILSSNPVEYEAIRAALSDERAEYYRSLEAKSQEAAIAWAGRSLEAARDYPNLTEAQLAKVAIVPRLLQSAAMTARYATLTSQLLTGQATDRVHQMPTKELTADELINEAITLGLVDKLAPSMQAEARRRMEALNVPARGS